MVRRRTRMTGWTCARRRSCGGLFADAKQVHSPEASDEASDVYTTTSDQSIHVNFRLAPTASLPVSPSLSRAHAVRSQSGLQLLGVPRHLCQRVQHLRRPRRHVGPQ
jgi:hypothetical protein